MSNKEMKRVEEISRPYFSLKKRVSKRPLNREAAIEEMVEIVKKGEKIRKMAELEKNEDHPKL